MDAFIPPEANTRDVHIDIRVFSFVSTGIRRTIDADAYDDAHCPTYKSEQHFRRRAARLADPDQNLSI